MNINLTLVVQMIVFATLILITMKWIWPPILQAMDERQRKIAQGLAAAEEGEKELSQARDKADAIIREARERANPRRQENAWPARRGPPPVTENPQDPRHAHTRGAMTGEACFTMRMMGAVSTRSTPSRAPTFAVRNW